MNSLCCPFQDCSYADIKVLIKILTYYLQHDYHPFIQPFLVKFIYSSKYKRINMHKEFCQQTDLLYANNETNVSTKYFQVRIILNYFLNNIR